MRNIEIAVGVFAALGIAALVMLAMQVSNLRDYSGDEGYELMARFENSGGLKVRSPVMMSGVRIGQVSEVKLDRTSFESLVVMTISSRYDNLPEDTSASIFTSGLLGEQYVALEPGGAEKTLKNQDEIKLTQSSLVLEQVIGQFLFNKAAE